MGYPKKSVWLVKIVVILFWKAEGHAWTCFTHLTDRATLHAVGQLNEMKDIKSELASSEYKIVSTKIIKGQVGWHSQYNVSTLNWLCLYTVSLIMANWSGNGSGSFFFADRWVRDGFLILDPCRTLHSSLSFCFDLMNIFELKYMNKQQN